MSSGNITVKKVIMGSQEDIDSDAGFVDGTPQYRWDQFWKLIAATNVFTKHYADFSKPLRRDIVNIIRA
ncbi:MAG: hypothetical protein FWC26_12980 [Fibromonadales bacterium]|nr:hypothetical protein [Fibromonadales bacterium]